MSLRKPTKKSSFSLVELMIVFLIIAISTMAGIPAYTSYAQRASVTEAVTILANYKKALGLFWSTESRLPQMGDTLISTPTDLPFGTAITDPNLLPDTLQSLLLTSSGNGVMIQAIVSTNSFSTVSDPNSTITLGALTQGHEIVFQCGNFTTNATLSTDVGFPNIGILPNGCNYNGVGAWLGT